MIRYTTFFIALLTPQLCFGVDATQLVLNAVEYWRGKSSYTVAEMIVTRPGWTRSSRMESWNKGNKHSLVRFTKPAKDAGNASLTVENSMWTFSPKVNKVLKIPASMMSQSWMGSDFSYKDLSKADDIVEHYDHRLLSEETADNIRIYVVEATPKADAPVVWGREVLKIREDNIIVEHLYYDQDMKLVKKLEATEVSSLGGRLYPTKMRMQKFEEAEHWTDIVHHQAAFDIELKDSLFTRSFLRNPRSLERFRIEE